MLFITCKKIEPVAPEVDPTLRQFKSHEDAPNNQVYFCSTDGKYNRDLNCFCEIGSLAFMKAAQAHPCDEVLFYLHGFNNQPQDALLQAAYLQKILDAHEGKSYLVVPVIWPCHDQVGILRDYWDDQKSADMSGFAIARALAMFVEWQKQNQRNDVPCMKVMNILAHSMGNRVLKEAMLNWGHYDSYSKVPMLFRNIFMVAADVVNNTLEPNQKGSFISYAAKNVVVYYSGDDRALQGSKLVNVESRPLTRRLGHCGPSPESLKLANVYSVDCDAINSKYDLLGHTYFMDAVGIGAIKEQPTLTHLKTQHGGLVFDHIKGCLDAGKVTTPKEFEIKTKKKGWWPF